MAVLSAILGVVAAWFAGLSVHRSSLSQQSRFPPSAEVAFPAQVPVNDNELVEVNASGRSTASSATVGNREFTNEEFRHHMHQLDSVGTAVPEHMTWSEMHFPQVAPTEISAAEHLARHGAFPLPDRSHIKRNVSLALGPIDLGWSSGCILDGSYERPLWVETWADVGHVTNQTFFFSRIGLEELTATDVLGKFRAAELIECAADAPCELLRTEDRRGHPIWSFNLCLAVDDITFVRQTVPYQAYPRSLSVRAQCMVCGVAKVDRFAAFGGQGLPHGSPGHENVYAYQEISRGPSCANGQLEVLSHDCWTHEEPWDMFWWYAIHKDDLQMLLSPKEQYCNLPLSAQCECAWHRAIRQQFLGLKPSVSNATDASGADSYYWLQASFAASGDTPVIDLERGPQRPANTDGLS